MVANIGGKKRNRLSRLKPRGGFAMGLVFGAIFSLVVNISTIQLQESLRKQRLLESLENEIFNNYIQAGIVIESNQKELDDDTPPNIFQLTHASFSDRVWESSEAILYVSQLEDVLQRRLHVYYGSFHNSYSSVLTNNAALAKEKLSSCKPEIIPMTEGEDALCLMWYQIILSIETGVASEIRDASLDLLLEFHPTKDRLDNWFLTLLMGKGAQKGLTSGQ